MCPCQRITHHVHVIPLQWPGSLQRSSHRVSHKYRLQFFQLCKCQNAMVTVFNEQETSSFVLCELVSLFAFFKNTSK